MRCACEASQYFHVNKHVGQFLDSNVLSSLDEIDGTVKSLTSSLDFVLELDLDNI